ncbi:3-demethylubiquinone-9 3-methyltransferase [Prosthecomicrobium hirschii]|uniref:3-demethylubiquinone-9 3-methyltransferase n=1 Tax=Prosthecodimorpha hirschii TaxID=665126 RepID=A0A0P6VWW8_9HYPH|nr:class I SAM-dependent methyltransferase [Prosthecomicrobium hirschii]KPL55707.1 3-demethylubiquinone-9 3-methyltransferase [Prosthecomicrobium hirschii]
MNELASISGYRYADSKLNDSHVYLLPQVERVLDDFEKASKGRTLIDVGCGNGSVTKLMSLRGYTCIGLDASVEGVRLANEMYPDIEILQGSAYDDLSSLHGTFDVVMSLEVVEHLYDPRKYAANLYSLVKEEGIVIISTPYHGYFKNLAMAVTGKLDKHFTALWDHGHIKFWSIATLTKLLREAGFSEIQFHRVGRIPPLAKSMIAVAKR